MLALSFSAYILAGGRSSRMGQDKALLPFRGVPLVTHIANLVASLKIAVTIVGPPSKYAHLGLRIIEDRFSPAPSTPPAATDAPPGPLAGIDAALRDGDASWKLMLGCDLPHLTTPFLTFLLDRASRSSAQAVVPLNTDGPEPLCAVYASDCGPILSDALARGIRKVTDLYFGLVVDYIPPADWRPFDPQGLLFKNINTPQDYESLE